MTPTQIIDAWISQNPTESATLARAALHAYCLDRDDEDELFINHHKYPDLHDVNKLIVEAIRETSFMKIE